jgi:D-alanyl-D-alanine carboxypeptidase
MNAAQPARAAHRFARRASRPTEISPDLMPALARLAALAVATAFAFAADLGVDRPAAAQSSGPTLVVDAATGAVLHEDRASQAWHPASTTKMMTAYVALRAIRAGRIGLETAIPASALAARQPRVKVYIRAGQEITLDAALKIMMVKSANDISYVIAEGVGGTVENFVAMMNAEARRLGLRDTEFRNPNGWHHPEQQTSARDLAVLTMTMLREFPEYSDYWGIGAVQIGRQVLNNTNGLIGRYSGANGFKTGFVCASGFNVVATATRGGRTLIAVVLGAYSGAERTVRAAQILDSAFNSWGGTGRTVQAIPASGTAARSICADVRAFGRGAPLADDADSAGPISFTAQGGAGSDFGMMSAGPVAAASSSVRTTASGRITLGPRERFEPIQLAYGRSAGSAAAPMAANVALARGSSPVAATASAPASGEQIASPAAASAAAAAAAGGAIGAAVAGRPASAVERARAAAAAGQIPLAAPGASDARAFAPGRVAAGAEAPLQLHGAIGLAAPAPPRPSQAAGIRPQARPAATAGEAGARPAAPTPATTRTAPRPPAQARPAQARPAQAKPAQAKPAQARPAQARSPQAQGRPAAAAPRRPATPST